MHREDMRFDVRTQNYRLLRKEYTNADLQDHLKELVDEASEAVETEVRFVSAASGRISRPGTPSE
jgi:hypothetical protein